ncbi:hypothetical protein HDU79_008118, partial [Rhizoclosmatium sp. JEL0117]
MFLTDWQALALRMVPARVERQGNPDEYDILYVNADAQGKDIKDKIISSKKFKLRENFNLQVFYDMSQESGQKRRHHVPLNVCMTGTTSVVTIRLYDLTITHLREQIEKQFEVKNTDYKIVTMELETSCETLVVEETIQECCINGVQLWVKQTESHINIPEAKIGEIKSENQQLQEVSDKDFDKDVFDCMLSYSWATKNQVHALFEALQKELPGIRIWIDKYEMTDNVYGTMANGVLKSTAIIVYEISFAGDIKKPLIPAYMFGTLSSGQIQELQQTPDIAATFLLTAGKKYANFGDSMPNSEKAKEFEEAVQTIVHELKSFLPQFSINTASNESSIQSGPDSEEYSLKKWLKPVDFTADLNMYKQEFVKGTRKWLQDEVTDWALEQEGSHVLWFYGAAGTGKSMFSYQITQDLPSDKFISTSPNKILVITIDALDELNPNSRNIILQILSETCHLLPDYVKLFVTGRPEQDIYYCLTKLKSLELEITLEDNFNDIEIVVEQRCQYLWKLNKMNQDLICEFLASNQYTADEALQEIEKFQGGPDGMYQVIAKEAKKSMPEE